MRRSRRVRVEEESSAGDKRALPILRSEKDSRTEAFLRLQRAAGNASVSALFEEGGAAAASSVKDVIGSPGRPLDDATRQAMESRLGQDFSGVRVHEDAMASESAKAVNAAAYTVGTNIVLGEGVSPQTEAGKRTLAHELTHVVQQRSGPVAGTPVPGGISVSDPSDRFEQEAERVADRAPAPGREGPSGGASPAAVQREAEEESSAGIPVVQREPRDYGISPGKLQLDPDIEAEILRIRIEQLLHPPNVLSALQNVHLNLAEPAKGEAFDFKPAPKEEPLVTPGPGSDTPKAGSPDDIVNAIMKVKAVDSAVSRLRLDASDRIKHDWRSLSGGEKAAVVVTSVLIGGATIGGIASDPKAREFALQQLDGKEAPVPGIDGLSIQFNRPDPNNVGFMLKFDVGSHLPKSWGFGSGD